MMNVVVKNWNYHKKYRTAKELVRIESKFKFRVPFVVAIFVIHYMSLSLMFVWSGNDIVS